MKKTFIQILIFGCIAVFSSCNGKIEEMQNRIDSLTNLANKQEQDNEELNDFVETISTSLDSIAMSENMIINAGGSEGTKPTKADIKENLENFANLIERQRAQIAQLEQRVNENSASRTKMKKIIQFMTLQLEEKEKEIKQLRAELDSKNVDITNLNQKINKLSDDNTQLTQTIQDKEEEIAIQDKNANICYYLIASKDELKASGVLSKGNLFKKSKLDPSSIDLRLFTQIDRRELTRLSIPSKKAKILTPIPEDSYSITSSKSSSVLDIIDTNKFWSATNVLIIQTN